MSDHAETVCCEMPMFRRDSYDQEYYYYVCPQCGTCTAEIRTDEELYDH